ncbi:MAG: DUF2490 domain-containing protein [Fidelibacterota bacterium]
MNKIILSAIVAITPLLGQIDETWHVYKVSRSLVSGSTFTIEQDFRHQEGSLYYMHGDLGVAFLRGQKIKLSLNYRQVFEKHANKWKPEYRPHINISSSKKIAGLLTSARSRFEYRIKETKKSVRNRDLLTIKSGRTFSGYRLVPYLADEIFYDLTEQEFNRNRFYVGIESKRFAVIKPAIYYLYQTSLSADQWNGIHIIGLKIALK